MAVKYIFSRGDNFYYRRRVPSFIAEYEIRKTIKVSLNTKDKQEAIRKANIYNDYIEDYWRSLVKGAGELDPESEYRRAIKLAKAHGFIYKNALDVSTEPLERIINRLDVATNAIEKPDTVSSILGGVEIPEILLSNCIDKYWLLCRDRLTNKSDDQIRKWKNPRIAVMDKFIDVINDKSLDSLTRTDILQFRDWWMDRVETGEIVAATVNKNMIYLKDILQTVSINNEIETDFDILFSKVKLKTVNTSRPPFEAEYVQKTLISSNALKGLNSEARFLIYAMADTGARESELIGLRSDDIFLNDDIPYIWIRPQKKRALKTPHSERKIPLVGTSLFAFQQLPAGFIHYKTSDAASNAINKFLRENNLKPTPNHSLYSLRHTFKDRLRDAEAPEEVIDELMGHKKSGPKYGRGHILEKKQAWLQKIAFDIPD